MLLDEFREQDESQTEPDRTPGLSILNNEHRPSERLHCISERINDEIKEEIDYLTVKNHPHVLHVINDRAHFQDDERDGKTASVKTAAADIPDLPEPGAEPAM